MVDEENVMSKKKVVNVKNRVLVLMLAMFVIFVVVLGYFIYKGQQDTGASASAAVIGTPSIESVPGVGTAPREYVKLQELQNLMQAKQAARTGGSAVPTLTRATYHDAGTFDALCPGGKCPPGVTVPGKGADCSVEALKRARAAGVSAAELRCKGCGAAALRAAGYTAGELRAAGFSAKELRDAGFTAEELKDAGFTAAEMKAAGFSAKDLKDLGYSAAELKDAGFSANDLKAAGFTAEDLAKAGFSEADLKAAGFSAADIASAMKARTDACDIETLKKQRAQGVSAAKLRAIGCGAAALRAAGYTAAELKAAGFSAKELKDAGFTAKELKDAGFTAAELKAAGFSAGELKAAGFSAKELKDAGFSAKQLRAAGFDASQLRAAGFSPKELLAAGYSKGELIRADVSPDELGLGATTHADASEKPAAATSAPAGDASVASIGEQAGTPAAAQQALERLQKQQEKDMTLQQRRQFMEQIQAAMTTQANDVFNSWTPPPTQTYVAGELANKNAEIVEGVASAAGGAGTAGFSPDANTDIVKAGSVMFAVLNTGINSDENSPIMATIVSGPYKNAKLIGSFKRTDQKVVLQFTMLNIEALKNSVPVNAIAIDPKTARTTLADHVDNHYMLRYGTLFASSFVSGLGKAISQSGSTTTSGSGGVTQVKDKLSNGELVFAGLGQVGTKFSSALGQVVNTPPTIKVYAGTAVGLLFMKDTPIPKLPKKTLGS